MKDMATYSLIALVILIWALAGVRHLRRILGSRRQVNLHAEIRLVADSLITEPDGISFDELVDAPTDWLEDLLCELKKMPVGQRYLHVAWKLINADNYTKSD